MGKGAALVLHRPHGGAGAGAKEVVGADQEAAAMAIGEGERGISRNGFWQYLIQFVTIISVGV